MMYNELEVENYLSEANTCYDKTIAKLGIRRTFVNQGEITIAVIGI